MVNMPMFHIGGMGVTFVMFVRGGSIAFVDRFDTATFLDTVRATSTTATFLLGVMASFLEKLPARADDADTPLRLVFMVPLAGDIAAFSGRFGCEVYTIFNMTEISTPIISDANPMVRGTCGRQRDGVDVRLVDGNDCEVPVGTVGEMIVRTDRPWGMNSGYYKNPAATASAWRNGWSGPRRFHLSLSCRPMTASLMSGRPRRDTWRHGPVDSLVPSSFRMVTRLRLAVA